MRAAVIIVPEIFSPVSSAAAHPAYIDHLHACQKADTRAMVITSWTSITKENTLYRRG
jgi:hypothetical protein